MCFIYLFIFFHHFSKGSNLLGLPYVSGYKTEFFSFQKQSPQKIDLSYKMDLVLWDCVGRIKLIL